MGQKRKGPRILGSEGSSETIRTEGYGPWAIGYALLLAIGYDIGALGYGLRLCGGYELVARSNTE